MRIKGTNRRAKSGGAMLLLTGLLALGWFVRSGKTSPPGLAGEELLISCDSESIVGTDDGFKFVTGDFLVNNGQSQKEKISRSGKYSSLANLESPFAMGAKLIVKGGERYRARIWRFNIHGAGALVVHGKWKDYRVMTDAFEVEPSGWAHLELTVYVPDTVRESVLNIYGWYQHEWADEVYFDDLEIWKMSAPWVSCTTEKKDSLWEIVQSGVHIHPFTEQQTENALSLKVLSFYPKPIEILGEGNSGWLTDSLAQPIVLGPLVDKSTPGSTLVELKPGAKYLYFRVAGSEKIYSELISAWPSPKHSSPYQELLHKGTPVESEFYDIQGDTLWFRAGKHIVEETIFIKAGYRVVFEPGVQLDFVKKAKFISFSPLTMQGTSENPIEIGSSDKSACGFSVLGGGKCDLSHVSFTGFNTLAENGWELTSAVTFYECEVGLDHVSVTDNLCEDALNLVRSTFDITDLEIARTFADGFDADFCTGTIRNSHFTDTGNDGMDFSGSEITIVDCLVENPGDKGLSVGEQATVWVTGNLSVKNAPIGMASKDKSELNIENSSVINCEVGFAAYQKKPEFGAGTIRANGIRMEGNTLNYQLSNGSVLILDGKTIR